MTKNEQLKVIIIQRITKEGRITFRDFMDMALYYPRLGYYMTGETRTGKAGDFATGPTTSGMFGEFMADFLRQTWEILGRGEFSIVEMGAERGLLASDIKDCLSEREPKMFLKTEYFAVEHGDPLPDVETGCFFSNELVDAFPVHRVRTNARGRLKEVYVTYKEGRFEEVLGAASTPDLDAYFEELVVKLPKNYTTEVNLQAVKWISEVSRHLKRGVLLTIDYGYESRELYQPYRAQGTLLGYKNHRTVDDPYANIGDQDLTSHVNFSALMHWGDKAGFITTKFTDQSHFLIDLGFEEKALSLRAAVKDDAEYYDKYLALKMLVMPEAMGETFKVLVQRKE